MNKDVGTIFRVGGGGGGGGGWARHPKSANYKLINTQPMLSHIDRAPVAQFICAFIYRCCEVLYH